MSPHPPKVRPLKVHPLEVRPLKVHRQTRPGRPRKARNPQGQRRIKMAQRLPAQLE